MAPPIEKPPDFFDRFFAFDRSGEVGQDGRPPPDEAERKKVVASAAEAAIARIKKDTVPEIRQLQSMLNEKAPEAVSANYLFFAQEQRDYHASYERLKQENEAFKKEVEEKNGVILKLTLGTGAAVAFAGFLTYWGL